MIEEEKLADSDELKEVYAVILNPIIAWLRENEDIPRSAGVTIKIAKAINIGVELSLSQGIGCYTSDKKNKH